MGTLGRSSVANHVAALTCTALALGLVWTQPSWAQSHDLKTVSGWQQRLEHERDVVNQLLDAEECPRACLALEAMRQAADRLCNMDPEKAGTSGRARLDGTAQKVLRACPDCKDAQQLTDPARDSTESKKCASKKTPPAAAKTEKGGCAACEVGTARTGMPLNGAVPAAALFFGLFALTARRRRRRLR